MARLQIRQTKSAINRPERQRATLAALGLRRIDGVVTRDSTPQLRGMIKRVAHLISVEEVE